MPEVSQALNLESDHFQGDMHTARLEHRFGAVFIQDAIVYMMTEAELRNVIEMVPVQCKTTRVVLYTPDDI